MLNISKDGESTISLDSLLQCFIMPIMNTFSPNVSSEFPLLPHVSVASYAFTLDLWEESGCIFCTVSHLVAVGSNKVPPELSPRLSKPTSQPLLLYQVLQPLTTFVALPWIPSMYFLHSGKPKTRHRTPDVVSQMLIRGERSLPSTHCGRVLWNAVQLLVRLFCCLGKHRTHEGLSNFYTF